MLIIFPLVDFSQYQSNPTFVLQFHDTFTTSNSHEFSWIFRPQTGFQSLLTTCNFKVGSFACTHVHHSVTAALISIYLSCVTRGFDSKCTHFTKCYKIQVLIQFWFGRKWLCVKFQREKGCPEQSQYSLLCEFLAENWYQSITVHTH
jgi:hypothetical protein